MVFDSVSEEQRKQFFRESYAAHLPGWYRISTCGKHLHHHRTVLIEFATFTIYAKYFLVAPFIFGCATRTLQHGFSRYIQTNALLSLNSVGMVLQKGNFNVVLQNKRTIYIAASMY